MIESVIAALKDHPWGLKLLVAGDLNANLVQPEVDQREEEIVAMLMEVVLEDIQSHFLP